MNADDVIFSLERQWKETNPFHSVSAATYAYFEDTGMPEFLKSIDKIDEHTVRFQLGPERRPFLADLAMPFNVIQSAEYGDQLLKAGTPGKLDEEPIGTGPFAFDGYQKDVAVRYRAFPDYWGRPPLISTLVFSITPAAAVRLAKLKAGECHVATFPNPADRRGNRGRSALEASGTRGFQRWLSRAEHDAAPLRRCTRASSH